MDAFGRGSLRRLTGLTFLSSMDLADPQEAQGGIIKRQKQWGWESYADKPSLKLTCASFAVGKLGATGKQPLFTWGSAHEPSQAYVSFREGP